MVCVICKIKKDDEIFGGEQKSVYFCAD